MLIFGNRKFPKALISLGEKDVADGLQVKLY
jgi:hypothetical protein